jgi:hypothetical protein
MDWIRLAEIKAQLPAFINRLVPSDVLNFLTTRAIYKKVEVIRVQTAKAHSRNSFLISALDEVSSQHRAWPLCSRRRMAVAIE